MEVINAQTNNSSFMQGKSRIMAGLDRTVSNERRNRPIRSLRHEVSMGRQQNNNDEDYGSSPLQLGLNEASLNNMQSKVKRGNRTEKNRMDSSTATRAHSRGDSRKIEIRMPIGGAVNLSTNLEVNSPKFGLEAPQISQGIHTSISQAAPLKRNVLEPLPKMLGTLDPSSNENHQANYYTNMDQMMKQ